MLRLFSAGLVATLLYVLSGVAKQYLIAAQLPVADVGFYGTWVARASLLQVLIPFPAYLDVLIRGFAPAADERLNQRMLAFGVRRELLLLTVLSLGVIGVLLVHGLLTHSLNEAVVALLLLLFAQYVNSTGDIMLRMIRAHGRFAMFMALRNLPGLVLIAALGVRSALAVVLTDVTAAVLIWWFVHRSKPFRGELPVAAPAVLHELPKEQITLWLARLFQYVSSSLLRIGVPLVFAAHETGLFFFACIAQTPTAVFLSVGNQLFGHDLARLKQGEVHRFLRIQLWFAAPNILYMVAIAILVPYWNWVIGHVPSLMKYQDIGPLVFAVALYSAVLSSDCQEFLLRSRGLSIVLLRYNLCSIIVQCLCLLAVFAMHLAPAATITLCAGMLAINLVAFTSYSFLKVVRVR
jgi:hypothetical protein